MGTVVIAGALLAALVAALVVVIGTDGRGRCRVVRDGAGQDWASGTALEVARSAPARSRMDA